MFPFFFFNDTATTEIYTLSLHDALPILVLHVSQLNRAPDATPQMHTLSQEIVVAINNAKGWLQQVHIDAKNLFYIDRKSTRLNSSHSQISYAVFCLKKKKNISITQPHDN